MWSRKGEGDYMKNSWSQSGYTVDGIGAGNIHV